MWEDDSSASTHDDVVAQMENWHEATSEESVDQPYDAMEVQASAEKSARDATGVGNSMAVDEVEERLENQLVVEVEIAAAAAAAVAVAAFASSSQQILEWLPSVLMVVAEEVGSQAEAIDEVGQMVEVEKTVTENAQNQDHHQMAWTDLETGISN